MAYPSDPAIPVTNPLEEFQRRCESIEEGYEFMLAYAAQGLSGEEGSQSGGQAREFLERVAAALSGLGDVFGTIVNSERPELIERYRAFKNVLDRDARDALAAVELVLAQPAISSQMVDNLNASIHLRALLTDIFLVDEVSKSRRHGVKRPNIETPQ